MKTNLALIGFMAAGKSVIGKALAIKLRLSFMDTDSLIVQKAGKSIVRIFEEDGESAFRKLEIAAVKTAARKQHMVIACGGGVVLNNINIERLKASATIIYLRAGAAKLIRRLYTDSEARPLLQTVDLNEEVRRLLKIRKSLYEAAADFSIDVSESVDRDIEKILSKLGKYASINT